MNAQNPQARQLRHQYLDALGITCWLPRTPLPGARPSPDWVWQYRQGIADAPDDADGFDDAAYASEPRSEAAAQTQAGASAAPERERTGPGRGALLDSLAAKGPAVKSAPEFAPAPTIARPPVPAAAPAPAAVSAAATAVVSAAATGAGSPIVAGVGGESLVQPLRRSEPQVIPEFKLAFLSMGDGLIIDSLPPQSRGGFSAAHRRLALALWRALGRPVAESPNAQILPWPAFTSRSLDQGWEQAQTAVQRKFDRVLEQSPARFVLLLGESAAQLVLQTRESGDGMRGVLFRPRSEVPALATASLSEMLQVPGCKRDVWRDLQPLIRHLHND